MTQWETVIGLEIHAQLATRSKIFSGAATAYGAPPNTQANLVDLAYPGVLPVLNAEAVRMAVKFGLSIGAVVAPRSVFARKNYFYPDLPKGYQISQYELPIVAGGHIDTIYADINRYSLYAFGVLAVLLAGYIAWRLMRRRRHGAPEAAASGESDPGPVAPAQSEIQGS